MALSSHDTAASPSDSSPSASPTPAAPPPNSRPDGGGAEHRERPTVLLTLQKSAFNASISIDDDAIYLLTSDAAYRIVFGKPPQEIPLDLSYGSTATQYSYLFWSKGAVWNASKPTGKLRKLAPLAHQPQYFVSSGRDFAWTDQSEEGRFTVQSLKGQKAVTLYTSEGRIEPATMIADWVFFVDRIADDAWRIGGVRVAGGVPTFTATKKGRTPAMLAARRDIYYYDLDKGDVRVLSPDFQHEETLVANFVCSPLAVSEHVFCSQVDGLYEIVDKDHEPRLIDKGASITAMAASPTKIAWISDIGPDKLAVKMLELRRPGD